MADPRAKIFAAFREALGGTIAPTQVPFLDDVCDQLKIPRASSMRAISDAGAFFAKVRAITGTLNQVQVDTINGLLEAATHWPLSWVAYGLATAWHEARFEPQPEWGRGKGKPYAKPGRHKQPQYGRGLVQLTWDPNYEWADEALQLGGKLLADFDLALDPDIATQILVKGMEQGAFCKDGADRPHSLKRHLPSERGTHEQFAAARRIINGIDKAQPIAGLAMKFQAALTAGGWA